MSASMIRVAVMAAALVASSGALAADKKVEPTAATSAARNQNVQRVTFMNDKLAVNLPKSLTRASGRMVVYNGESGGVVLAAQPGPSKQTPADFVAMFEADNKASDPKLKVLAKGEIKVGDLTLQRIEMIMKDPEIGPVYLMSAFGISHGRVFSIGITADADEQVTWAKDANDILQSLTEV